VVGTSTSLIENEASAKGKVLPWIGKEKMKMSSSGLLPKVQAAQGNGNPSKRTCGIRGEFQVTLITQKKRKGMKVLVSHIERRSG